MSALPIAKDVFGVTRHGIDVDRYTLTNTSGLTLRVMTYGATVTELRAPDRNGRLDDVVLGFDRLEQYETESPYFGCVIGRVAFRIVNGRFDLDGQSYRLALNNGAHHLHGGTGGLSWRVWDAEPVAIDGAPGVRLTCSSPDGDQGYPGNLLVEVIYSLNDDGEMRIDYAATADRPTPVNLTHHGYFNLAGAASGDVLDHVLWLDADRYSVTDASLAPTGELVRYDFTTPTAIGERLERVDGTTRGYDLAYLLRRPAGRYAHVATARDPRSGRILEIDTTAPAMIFYTGDYLDGTLAGKAGTVYPRHAGFCLEPGHLPDSVHHPGFPSVIIRPGQTYRQSSTYRFLAE